MPRRSESRKNTNDFTRPIWPIWKIIVQQSHRKRWAVGGFVSLGRYKNSFARSLRRWTENDVSGSDVSLFHFQDMESFAERMRKAEEIEAETSDPDE